MRDKWAKAVNVLQVLNSEHGCNPDAVEALRTAEAAIAALDKIYHMCALYDTHLYTRLVKDILQEV